MSENVKLWDVTNSICPQETHEIRETILSSTKPLKLRKLLWFSQDYHSIKFALRPPLGWSPAIYPVATPMVAELDGDSASVLD